MKQPKSNAEADNTRPVTILDVAKAAGVSPMTVSRVLNSRQLVSPATAKRVDGAIHKLGYVANSAARRLVSGRSRIIALEAPQYDPTSGWGLELHAGAVQRATELGYEILLHPYLLKSADSASKLTQLVKNGTADGLILFPARPEHKAILTALNNRDIPFVVLLPPDNCFSFPRVSVTDFAGAKDLATHLLDLGHRRIAIILGPEFLQSSMDREAGFRAAMQSAGIAVEDQLVVRGDMRFQSGLILGRHLLRMSQPPTAIIAITDEMAAGVLQAAYRLDLSVPDDVSVCGYDNSSLSLKTIPPLTTVNHPAREVAAAAVEMLITRIERSEIDAFRELATSIVVRESSGPPKDA